MSAWNFITNPINGEKLSIFSSAGRELLKSYLKVIKNQQTGGNYFLDTSAEPVGGQAPVVGYEGCEGPQVGGNYFLDTSAEPVGGQAPVVGYEGCDGPPQTGGDYNLGLENPTIGGQAEVVGYQQVPNHPPHPNVGN